MNKLSTAKRVQIVGMMTEGNSLRAITRMTGASINTVTKLLVDLGTACAKYHDEHVRNVTSKRIEADEAWCFCYARRERMASTPISSRSIRRSGPRSTTRG